MAWMDRTFELMLDLFRDQDQLAPGSASTTRRALAAVPDLPPSPRIADFGCGHGASALVLAEQTGGQVLALDLMDSAVGKTRARAAEAGLSDRIEVVRGDMAEPPVEPGSLDLVWAEGAAYAIGFTNALDRWKPLLADGGSIGVSEICWRTDDPPAEARAYWAAEYADMRPADAAIADFDERFERIEHFFQPRSDWAAYYEPLVPVLPRFRERHLDDPLAEQVAAQMEAEIEAWRRWGGHVGYLFLVGSR